LRPGFFIACPVTLYISSINLTSMPAPALCCPASLVDHCLAWILVWPGGCSLGFPWGLSGCLADQLPGDIEEGYMCTTRHPSPGYFLRHANQISAQLVDPLQLFPFALTN